MDVICLKIKFMKRLLILVLFILAGKAYGQRYQGMPQRYVTPGMRIDSVLSIPIGITSLRNTGWSGGQDTGQIRYNKLDSSVYIYTGSQWLKVVRASAGTLQEVTDNGNSTSNLIRFSDGNNWDIGNNGQGSFIVQGSTGGAIELNDNGQLIVGGNIGTYMLHPPTTTGITDTIQNKSGTIALLSDIASQGLQDVIDVNPDLDKANTINAAGFNYTDSNFIVRKFIGNGFIFSDITDGTGEVSSTGNGSFVVGEIYNVGKIQSTQFGSFAGGSSENNGLIRAEGDGSFAFGKADGDTLLSFGTATILLGQDLIDTSNNSILIGKGLRNNVNNRIGLGYSLGKNIIIGANNLHNNISEDSLITTDINGNLKLKHLGITSFTKQQDTISLASFGAGSVALSDTLAFTTSAIYGSFYNSGSDTLVITSVQVGLQGTSPSINTKIWFNDSLNVTAGATALVNAGNTCTNIYTGTTISSFDNTKIPPGNWVWVSTPTVTTKPTYFSLTLIGYKSRR